MRKILVSGRVTLPTGEVNNYSPLSIPGAKETTPSVHFTYSLQRSPLLGLGVSPDKQTDGQTESIQSSVVLDPE